MPELPEVEAARKRLAAVATGKRIKSIQTLEDSIVFSGTTHNHFATALEGQTVRDVRRKGKNFYMVLSGASLHPIFHFGMAGMAHVTITFEDVATGKTNEWAYCDGRRLGRIKLVEAEPDNVEAHPPMSELGADPLLDMPSVDSLRSALGKRKAPIKAVLLDQNGPLCGLGNWMVDEILYQSAIHPAVHAAYLAEPDQATLFDELYNQIRNVTETAVAADAKASHFPSTWLFKHRWAKGKKKKADDPGFQLPDGRSANISFVTVGGRTSAVVDEVQILPPEFAAQSYTKKRARRSAASKERGKSESDGEEARDQDEDGVKPTAEAAVTSPHFKHTRKRKAPASPSPTKRRRQPKKEEDTDE